MSACVYISYYKFVIVVTLIIVITFNLNIMDQEIKNLFSTLQKPDRVATANSILSYIKNNFGNSNNTSDNREK